MANQRDLTEEPIPLWKLPGDFWANSIILTGAALCASCFGFLAIIAGLARADDSGSSIVAAVAAHALVLVPWGIDIAGIIITVERIHRRKSAFHLWMIGMACMGVNFFLMRWLLSV